MQKTWHPDLISRRVTPVLVCMFIIASGCGSVNDQAEVTAPSTNSANAVTNLESKSPSPATVDSPPAAESYTPATIASPHSSTDKTATSIATATSAVSTPEITTTAPEDQQQMTVAEYAVWCAEIEESANATGLAPNATGITWGTFKTLLNSAEQAYASANPPKVLTDYHNYRASVITVMRGVAEEKDASLLVKPEDLFDPRIMAIALVSPSDDELPSDVRQQLVDSGCISESSSTDSGGLMEGDSPKEVKVIGVGEEFEGGVEGVAITIDDFAWEGEIRSGDDWVFTPDDGSRFLVVTFTILNMGSQDFEPRLVQNGFYVEDAAGVQTHGTRLLGIEDVSDERWGVIMADVARAGKTVRTLKIYEIKNQSSELVLRSDDFGVFVDIPERPQ